MPDEPATQPDDERPQEPEHALLGEPGTGSIHDRLARIEATIGYIKRGGKLQSKAANFTYATIDQLREVIRPLLGAEGVTMVPHKLKVVRSEQIITEKSNDRGSYQSVQWDTLLRITWRLACGPVGGDDFIDVPSFGRSLNNSDKDFNTATTYAERNALLAIFHISSGDDPEQERPTVEGTRVREPQPRGRRGGAPNPTDGSYPPPTPAADPPTDEQRGEAARIRIVLTGIGRVPEDQFDSWVMRMCEGEFNARPRDLNRAQFEVLLDALREQVGKNPLVPKGWDPKTGEIPQSAETPSEPAKPADVPGDQLAPPAVPAPAPAVPDPSPAAQAAIEEAAKAAQGETAPRTDPDNPPPRPGQTFEEAREVVARAGLPDAILIGVMVNAGAARPEELDTDTAKRVAFLAALNQKIEEASRG